jgi:acetyltransferase EpsM
LWKYKAFKQNAVTKITDMFVIIVGVGSHAEVVQSILGAKDLLGFVSFGEETPKEVLSPYLGRLKDLSATNFERERDNISFIVAIGDNHLRKQVVEEIIKKFPFSPFANVISKQAYIAEGVKIGSGNVVSPGAMIQVGVTLGDHNIVNTNSSIDHHCEVRSFIHIAPNVALCGTVTLHEGVFIGAGLL